MLVVYTAIVCIEKPAEAQAGGVLTAIWDLWAAGIAGSHHCNNAWSCTSDTISTSRGAKSRYMVWVWMVTTAFIVATLITVKRRSYKNMPHALREAFAADAFFGASPFLYN
jgi:hypothetical protein